MDRDAIICLRWYINLSRKTLVVVEYWYTDFTYFVTVHDVNKTSEGIGVHRNVKRLQGQGIGTRPWHVVWGLRLVFHEGCQIFDGKLQNETLLMLYCLVLDKWSLNALYTISPKLWQLCTILIKNNDISLLDVEHIVAKFHFENWNSENLKGLKVSKL